MKPKDFPVGTILKGNRGAVVVRVSEESVYHLDYYEFYDINAAWSQEYEPITEADLTERQACKFRGLLPLREVKQACTCELMSLMAHGCTCGCGWIKKERTNQQHDVVRHNG